MAARQAAQFGLQTKSQTAPVAWAQQSMLFALFFVGLMLLHAPLLRLPYFWDEAGYYVPAARDLYLTGTLIPQSTPSNAHPPLVMAWLALAWRAFGYSPLVTRTAMIALSAFSLLGVFRLARVAANPQVAWATTALVAVYPVYFTQSSLAQVDLPAAGFTFWALAAYIEDCRWKQVLWFSLAALAKETAILAPLALLGWELFAYFLPPRWREILPPQGRRTHWAYLLLPAAPLACWYGFHYSKTDFLLGNPRFGHATLAVVGILRALFADAGRIAGDAMSAAEAGAGGTCANSFLDAGDVPFRGARLPRLYVGRRWSGAGSVHAARGPTGDACDGVDAVAAVPILAIDCGRDCLCICRQSI